MPIFNVLIEVITGVEGGRVVNCRVRDTSEEPDAGR